MDDYAVYYNLFDKDQMLFVKPYEECLTKDGTQVLMRGTQKECRQYVIKNQRTPTRRWV
jgi:hypothetical protein